MAAARSESSLTCSMLILVVLTYWQYSAQAASSGFQQSTNSSQVNGSQIIRIDLIHRDHPLSPIAPAEGTTVSDRLQAAAKRSHDRSLLMSRGRRLSAFRTPTTAMSYEYSISIAFGTPPQQFVAFVDTGSDLVWIQCAPCTACYPNTRLFDPTFSSSEAYVPCSDSTLCIPNNFGIAPPTCQLNSNYCLIKYPYSGGTQIEGVLTTETMTLTNTAGGATPNIVAESFVMGCMNNNLGVPLPPKYDGIVGFGRGLLSLPSQFSARGDLKVFAVCLVPFLSTTTLTSSLSFGSRDATNLVFTPLVAGDVPSHYNVNMVGVSVGGVDIGIPSTGSVIFDTGTVLTTFAPAIVDIIHQSIISRFAYPVVPGTGDARDMLCFDLRGVATPSWPTMTYHFAAAPGVVDFDLSPLNLFVPGAADYVVCLAIVKGSTNIIGNIQQANHYIEHDVELSRIGWAYKDCTTP